MPKGNIFKTRFAQMMNNVATGAAGSDLIFNEVDTGGAQNGTLVIVLDNAAGSDQANVEVWTSSASNFATSGTALSAVASDGTAKVLIASDRSSFYAQGNLGTAISDVTVSSNTIANLTEDGTYIINLPNVSRYVNVQYDSDGTGSKISAVFIGHDLLEAPWAGARTAY